QPSARVPDARPRPECASPRRNRSRSRSGCQHHGPLSGSAYWWRQLLCSSRSLASQACARDSRDHLIAREPRDAMRVGKMARASRDLLGENVVRIIKHYGGDIPYRSRFHHVDELGVHRLVANTMRDDIDARAHDRFCIIEVIDVSGYPQAILMRLIDHSGINFRLNLGHQPTGTIEPDLDHIGLAGRHLTDGLPCHGYRVGSRTLVLTDLTNGRRWLAADRTDALIGSEEVCTG